MRDDLDDLSRRVRRLERRDPPLAAEFTTTATDPGDDLRVVARGWDEGEHTFGPVRWSPIGGALPQTGDEAVILERDDGVWQVVSWWSDSQGTGVAQSALDALDARLDALEAFKVSARRTTTATMAVGTNGFTLDLTGFTAGQAMVTGIVAATHHNWTWYPNGNFGGMVFTNSGASQSVTVTYHVVGT